MAISTLEMNIIVGLVTILIVFVLVRPSRYVQGSSDVNVQVLALGDIGRSPRMRYHALSIAQNGAQVQLMGFLDSELDDDIKNNNLIDIVPIPSPAKWLQTSNRLLFLVVAPLKVLHQVWLLWQTLAYHVRPAQWLLVQNPPSIPTLLLATVICYLRGQKMVIDWHNFGYSILALKLGEKHPLVRIAWAYEFFFATFATHHIVVTDAMGHVLRDQLGLRASIRTLHDRPADIFQPMDATKRLAFLQQYKSVLKHYNSLADEKAYLLVSSTSWTPDEDFSILLDALCQYSQRAASGSNLPEVVIVITGKGPQKQHYETLIDKLTSQGMLSKVHIYTDWLSFSDYARLLAAADLGISLHTSSSGVDLPMKVVDMFGAGLPVLGFSQFAAWPELVTEGVDGRGFGNADEMAMILQELLHPSHTRLDGLKAGALKQSKRRWSDEWVVMKGTLGLG
ncbi:Chitobiosyldiphosphodolichol beta-mannosyltransferase [Cyphellophora attinorum]|uniref:Chitobiosyldiphosphodolichol beta-mannosyltransferase n=1 Tax=Cyphellophora attinorum TaxID=1664694 RepID=A0A0N1HBA2_9EURO|nr:Chitobiosyldiphosphodolichol beta-mannosyltransferase [Phialophora attinorum]KPI40417.1 Chitobiosyldiphosphodolichol beta-mannosyltransferase [Phialophora attinorum]